MRLRNSPCTAALAGSRRRLRTPIPTLGVFQKWVEQPGVILSLLRVADTGWVRSPVDESTTKKTICTETWWPP